MNASVRCRLRWLSVLVGVALMVARAGDRRREEARVGREHENAVRQAARPTVWILPRFVQVPHARDRIQAEQHAYARRDPQMRRALAGRRIVVKLLPDHTLRDEEWNRREARDLVNLQACLIALAVLEHDRTLGRRRLRGSLRRGKIDRRAVRRRHERQVRYQTSVERGVRRGVDERRLRGRGRHRQGEQTNRRRRTPKHRRGHRNVLRY